MTITADKNKWKIIIRIVVFVQVTDLRGLTTIRFTIEDKRRPAFNLFPYSAQDKKWWKWARFVERVCKSKYSKKNMILTLYYMYATFLQWWRLGNLKNKLSGTLNPENALLVCDESVIFNTRRNRSIENLLFRCDNRLGVTVVPKVHTLHVW